MLEETKLRLTQPSLVELGLGLSLAKKVLTSEGDSGSCLVSSWTSHIHQSSEEFVKIYNLEICSFMKWKREKDLFESIIDIEMKLY